MGWSSRCPSIGSHRRLYLGGGVGVCGVLSDEYSSTGVLILPFGVCCRVEVKLGITVGDVHSDDEFVYVSDVSVGFVGLILLSRD